MLAPSLASDARFEAELLLAATLSVNRAALVARNGETLDADVIADYLARVTRRAAGEPFAYVTGRRGFWTLDLAVTPDVLVPRPETELLVDLALSFGEGIESRPVRLVDLGTGSGAIALALAAERPQWEVTATDLSPAALAVASANAVRHDLQRVQFLEGSWFEPLPGRAFDLVISNPPYVAADDPSMRSLGFEPRLALTPGADALMALREIIDRAPAHLRPGGYLLLEHGATQATVVTEMLVARGFHHVGSHPDLAGHLRVSVGRWP